MKKNVRLIVLLVIAVLVLCAGLIVVLNLPDQNNTGNVKTTKAADLLLYDKTDLDAEEISVSNSGGDYVLYGLSYKDQVSVQQSSDSSANERAEAVSSGINMIYTMSGYEDIDLSKNMTDQLSHQCSVLTALKLVDKSGEKDAEYGLDKPVSTVKTTFSDDSTETVYIGKTAPDNQGLYCRYGNSKNVYLVQADSVNMFLIKKLQMFDKTISDEYSELVDNKDENGITGLSLSGKAYEKPIEIDSKADISITSKYKMRSPNHEICNEKIVDQTGKSLYGISGSEVVAAKLTDEELKKYGLAEPYMIIKTKAKDGSSVAIAASEADKDGNCYVMNDGGDLIFKFSKDDIKDWYGIGYEDFLSDTIVAPNVINLTGINAEYNGEKADVTIKNEKVENQLYEETVQTTAEVNGKRVNYNNIDIFLNNLSGMRRKSFDVKSVDGWDKQGTITLCYEKDKEDNDESSAENKEKERSKDELVIYKNSKGEYAVELNGSVECKVEPGYAQLLLEQIPILAAGEKELQSIVYEEEQGSASSEDASKQEKNEGSSAE